MYGIFVAVTVRVATLASSGRPAMYRMAAATCAASITGSGRMLPSACRAPDSDSLVMSLRALPMSICPHAMSYGRPSSAVAFVSPVTACLVAVYAAARGLGACAAIDPLLMIRPPCGRCLRITRKASRVHRKTPVRFTATTACHSGNGTSSRSRAGAPMPALLTRRSSRPYRSTTASNNSRTLPSSLTSVGAAYRAQGWPAPSRTTWSSASRLRPASATVQPSAASARALAAPMPLPAPVTTAILGPAAIIEPSGCLLSSAHPPRKFAFVPLAQGPDLQVAAAFNQDAQPSALTTLKRPPSAGALMVAVVGVIEKFEWNRSQESKKWFRAGAPPRGSGQRDRCRRLTTPARGQFLERGPPPGRLGSSARASSAHR